jgi:hypothetical protein
LDNAWFSRKLTSASLDLGVLRGFFFMRIVSNAKCCS